MEKFWESVKQEETALPATSAGQAVTMRTISPVYHENAILIFTSPASQKYRQLKKDAHCRVAVRGCFIEAKAEFLGHTMLEENTALRNEYSEKFSDALRKTLLLEAET